jgi:tetratricopeptide (TPR) repeat protein
MGFFRDFLRRLLGKTPPLPHSLEGEGGPPPASPLSLGSAPSADEELQKRLDRLEQEALERIRIEQQNERRDSHSGRRKLPRPAHVQQLGNSPMVTFLQGNVQMMMDRDNFDYTYGDADGPDPAQRDLDELLPRVTRVCVLEGAMFQGRALGGGVLFDTRDTQSIRDLATCLQIVEDPKTFGHCACLGGPTMELYVGLEHVATIGLQHGRAIRWKQWYHDGQLLAGDRLTRWLQEQGVDPTRLEAIYQRGNNFLFGDHNAASERSQEAQQLCVKAQERAQEGKLAEALELCSRALTRDPEQAEAHALRGQVHYHAGHLPEAAADCSAAIDRGLRAAAVYFIRAIAHDGAGRLEEALADCSMALHLDPAHAGAWNSRGLIRCRLDRLDEARVDFSEAIRLEPNWFLPYLYRGQVAHGRGQVDQALADYDRAVELVKAASPPGEAEGDPMAALVYCRRGDARFDLFREDEAEADFDEAYRHHPAEALSYRGDMWLRRTRPERAKEVFAQLIGLRPEDTQGFLGRGTASEALGDLEQANADYSEAIRLQPASGNGYVLRARVRQRQGRPEEALADLSEHLRQHPEAAMARLFRAALHKERKDLAAALDDLNAAHRAAPDNFNVCNNLAWLLATCSEAHLRDGARAVALARQACQATEWNHPFCLGTLGAALAETGAFPEAIRWQTEALELYPEEEKAAGRARLELYRDGRPYRE